MVHGEGFYLVLKDSLELSILNISNPDEDDVLKGQLVHPLKSFQVENSAHVAQGHAVITVLRPDSMRWVHHVGMSIDPNYLQVGVLAQHP